MSEQGQNSQNNVDVTLKYDSEGYQDAIQKLQGLEKLIKDIKKDLGSVTMPAIKGMSAALAQARDLNSTIASLNSVSGRKDVSHENAVMVTAMLNSQDRALKVQKQLAKNEEVNLQRQAFLGKLDKKKIQEQSKNIENLKAINRGLDEAARAGKPQAALQAQVNKLIEADIKRRKDKAQKERTDELRARVEANNVAKQYAREAVEGGTSFNKKALQAKLNKTDLTQLSAFERAMNAEKLKAGYIETPQIREFNTQVAKRRAYLTAPEVKLKPQEIVDKITTGAFTQADVNHAVTQIRKQLTHATKTAADRDTLVSLHQGLIDIRKAGAKQFTPPSPYQEAKIAQEKHAETLLANRFTLQSIQTATKAQIEEQLKASTIMSHPTKAPFGSDPYNKEKEYQDLLKNRLQVMKENEKESKKQEQLAKIRADNDITRIKEEIRATEELGKLKSLQRQLNTRLQAEIKADPKSTQVIELEQHKAALADKIRNVNTPKEILDLTRQGQDLKVNNVEAIKANRVTAAEKAAQKAKSNAEKLDELFAGHYNSKAKIDALDSVGLKRAKDAFNLALETGRVSKKDEHMARTTLEYITSRAKEMAKIAQHNQNIRNLALTHYKDEQDLHGLKKAELDLAQKVIAYRIRNGKLTKDEAIYQQELLNIAKRRDNILTMQSKRQDEAYQREKRLGQITHLEGDGGAAMGIIQAGFMMRSQVLQGLGGIFSGAFDSAVQLDKAFRNLQAISASTNYEMATMKVNLINVAQASKFSAAEVGETAVMLAQAGLSIQEIGASMKGIITLAQATGTDLAKSVDVVTSVLSIFNKSATETDTIVNQLTAALNESKLDINKMALGLQYAGNIASDSGVSFEELTAALGATANAGIRSGSTLGTGLRQMFIDLQKPNEKLTKRLETLGLTLDQVSFRSQGLEGVLRNLRNAGFSSADAFETFEVRSAAAFSALSGNLTDFHDLQEELADTNAAFEANNVQMESFAVQLDHLKSNMGILAAEGLKPTLSFLRDLTKNMAHAMENTEEGVGWIQVMTSAFAALTVGVTLVWFSRLIGGLLSTAAAFAGLSRGLTLTRYGFIGIVGILGTLYLQWQAHTNEVERLNTELDKTKGKYNDLKAELQSQESTLSNVDEALKNLVDRYAVLKDDSQQTALVTKSLQDQFNQFGAELDDVAGNKIENVIQKVRDLRSELAKELKETIVKEADAKLKLQQETEAAAKARLAESKPFGLRKGFTAASLSTDQYLAAYNNPEFFKLYKEFNKGALKAQQENRILSQEEFSPENLAFKMRKIIGDVKNPNQNRLLSEVLEQLKTDYADVETVINGPKKQSKIESDKTKAVNKIDRSELFNAPNAIGGASDALMMAFNTDINTISDRKDINNQQKKKLHSEKAKEYLAKFEKKIANAQSYISTLDADNKEGYTELMTKVFAQQGEIRKFISDNDKEFRKREMKRLETEIETAEYELRLAQKLQADSTGLDTLEKRAAVTAAKQKKVNDLKRDKLRLEVKEEDNADLILANYENRLKTQNDDTARTLAEQQKRIKDDAKSSRNSKLNIKHKADLDAKKEALDAFYQDIKNREKNLESRQAAERFQAEAKTYKPLTTGNMFDQLNKDEKKAAQAKANATGVSQEYSVFGSARGAFARQAARFDNESLQKKQVQEKLALETAILFDLQQKKSNLNLEAYNKLIADQVVLEKEVTRLDNIAENARLDKDKEQLRLAQEALQRNKEAQEAHKAEEDKLNQDIDTRNNTIENLKNNLQALIDKYDLLDTTMTAGVQSMTSGLSGIFSDWATGAIKNTEDVKEAFRSLGQSILQSMAKVVSDRLAQQFMGFLLNGLGNAFGLGEINLGVGTPKQVTVSTGGLITATGVKHFNGGGFVSGTDIGRDSVPALLQPNEYVIQRSAVQAVGTPFLQSLNQLTTGSVRQGASALGGSKPMVQNVMKSSPPVNVYVVSPEQQRQMGPEDVVVALQDDILRGGTTKKLLKAVMTGEV